MSGRDREMTGAAPVSVSSAGDRGRRVLGRREFVRTSGGLLALSALGASCEDGVTDPSAGTVRLTVNGLGSGLGSGGSITITGPELYYTADVPASGVIERAVPAGTAHVAYTPPTGYTMAAGAVNELDVTVTAKMLTEISFDVIELQASGTVRVTVAGLASGQSSGGSAQVQRIDVGGQTPIALNVPGSGSAQLSVAAGTYRVTYTSPSGYELTVGQVNPRDVVIAIDQTTTVAFAVREAAVPSGLLFFSDWRTARGFSEQAYTDGGKWDWVSNNRGVLNKEIVAATGLDFPSSNVFRVIATAEAQGWSELRVTTLPIIPVGGRRFYRWYIRIVQPNGLADNETHPIQDGGGGSVSNWDFEVRNSNGTWTPRFDSRIPNGAWAMRPLNKGATYRFELQIHRTATNGFQAHMRVYDSGNNLIATDADFGNLYAPGTTLANNPTFSFQNLSSTGVLLCGCNGIGGTNPFPFTYAYEGCFAIRTDDWCGPYTGAY